MHNNIYGRACMVDKMFAPPLFFQWRHWLVLKLSKVNLKRKRDSFCLENICNFIFLYFDPQIHKQAVIFVSIWGLEQHNLLGPHRLCSAKLRKYINACMSECMRSNNVKDIYCTNAACRVDRNNIWVVIFSVYLQKLIHLT